MKKFTGAITALITPFKKDGQVDTTPLQELVKFQLKNGINGIVPCGSTGEAATLSLEEYQLVIKTVVKEVKAKVPVIAGASSNDTQKAVHLSKLAKEAGADALLHVTPYYNKPTPKGLTAHFKAISDAVNLPIIIYNVPGRTGLNMSAQTTLSIASKVSHVVGVKEASGNIMQMMEIIQSAPKNFSILSGDDAITLPLMALGGDGCISVIANEIPKEFTQMIHACLDKDWEKAKKLHYKMLDLMNANFIETNPLPVKTALALMGKIQEVFRLPLVPMEEKNKEILKKILKGQNLI